MFSISFFIFLFDINFETLLSISRVLILIFKHVFNSIKIFHIYISLEYILNKLKFFISNIDLKQKFIRLLKKYVKLNVAKKKYINLFKINNVSKYVKKD